MGYYSVFRQRIQEDNMSNATIQEPIRLAVISRAGVICDTIEFELNGRTQSLPNCPASWQAIHENAQLHRAVQRHYDHDNVPHDTEWLQSPMYLARKRRLV
jgi:hypothetical protein